MYSCKKIQRKNDMTQILYDIKAKKNGVNFLWCCFFYKITYAYLCHEIVKEDNKVCKRIKVGVFVYVHIRNWSASVYAHIRKPTIFVYAHIWKLTAFVYAHIQKWLSFVYSHIQKWSTSVYAHIQKPAFENEFSGC